MQSFPVVVRLCRFLKGVLRQYPLSDIGQQRANEKRFAPVEAICNIRPVSASTQKTELWFCGLILLLSLQSVVRRLARVLAYLSRAESQEPCFDYRENYSHARGLLRELRRGTPKPFEVSFVLCYGIQYSKWLRIHAAREAQKACDVLMTAWGWVPKWARGPAQIELNFSAAACGAHFLGRGIEPARIPTPEPARPKVRKAAA